MTIMKRIEALEVRLRPRGLTHVHYAGDDGPPCAVCVEHGPPGPGDVIIRVSYEAEAERARRA